MKRAPLFLLLTASALFAAALPACADEGQGLQLTPRWQARVQVSSLDGSSSEAQRYGGSRLLSANLLGDYYLTGPGFGGLRGGLRATGGMLVGSLSLAQSSGGLALGSGATRLGSGLAIGQRSVNLLGANTEAGDPQASLSYFGIGYTGQSLRSGLSFSADLGLISSTGGLRLGRTNAQDMEELLRDLRFKPVLQLGLSYSY